jgi:hypothetical protein
LTALVLGGLEPADDNQGAIVRLCTLPLSGQREEGFSSKNSRGIADFFALPFHFDLHSTTARGRGDEILCI